MHHFIITQEPKRGRREGYVVKVSVVEAKTARKAIELTARDFEPDPSIFKKPVAVRLQLNHCYRL